MVPVTFADTNPSRVNAVVARFGTGFAESLVAARSNVQPSSVTVLANLSGNAVGVADALAANAREPAIKTDDTAAHVPIAFPMRRFPVKVWMVSVVVVAMVGLPGVSRNPRNQSDCGNLTERLTGTLQHRLHARLASNARSHPPKVVLEVTETFPEHSDQAVCSREGCDEPHDHEMVTDGSWAVIIRQPDTDRC